MSSGKRAAFDDPEIVERFADLVIKTAANLQPGQLLAIGSEIGKETVTRALAAAGYRHGAKFVDVAYFDLHVKRARLQHAPDDTLDYVPPWYGERILELGRARAARVGLTGPAHPGLLSDLDPSRVGRDQLPAVRETGKVVNERTTNWTAVPCPTRPWAQLVHPDLDPEDAWVKLCDQILHVCRLDTEDPIAAWSERAEALVSAAARVTERRFDALRFVGPGTDLTVGLLPTSKFLAARFETVDGITHLPNLPSEEIFTSPDPLRADGVVRATKPLVLGGSIIRGLEVEFREGRAVRTTPTRTPRSCAHTRRATRTPTGWGRRRWSTPTAVSARWTPSSSTRCWMRTRRVISRSATPTKCAWTTPRPTRSTTRPSTWTS
jgi:aminopeptidase